MAQDRGARAREGRTTGNGSDDPRRPHSIRFADSEWRLVEAAALRQGIPAGELVRAAALTAAGERLEKPAEAVLAPGHLALIEATYRAVYVLATLGRERMIDDGRDYDLDDLVREARKTMLETMEEGPA